MSIMESDANLKVAYIGIRSKAMSYAQFVVTSLTEVSGGLGGRAHWARNQNPNS